MSLQTRIIALVSAVLLVSIALGAALAGIEGRLAVATEIRSALHSGGQAVASVYEDLPRSDHQLRDLRQLTASFDGDRHLAVSLYDGVGARLAVSRPDVDAARAPGWFERWIAPQVAPVVLPTPRGVAPAVIRLTATPQSDIAALWSELSALVGVMAAATLLCLALISLTVGAALAPLRMLAGGLARIGRGDYQGRAPERGPSEVRELERSFNAMAEQLQAMARLNEKLEGQLLTIQEEERAEIARDLHDEVGPRLFAVSLDAQLIAQHLADGRPEAVQGQVEAIQTGVRHVQREVRALVARLRPSSPIELGLKRAVEDLAAFWRARRPEVAFALALAPDEALLTDGAKETAYRVVQEAVSNAVRHARPRRIGVALRHTAGALEVEVDNDGVTPRAEPRRRRSFGLEGMRERVRAAGGRLEVGAYGAGEGQWRVFVSLPVEAAAERAQGCEAAA